MTNEPVFISNEVLASLLTAPDSSVVLVAPSRAQAVIIYNRAELVALQVDPTLKCYPGFRAIKRSSTSSGVMRVISIDEAEKINPSDAVIRTVC